MSKFTASATADPMEYDFTAFGGGAGVIPEPSNKQLASFFEFILGMKHLLPSAEAMTDVNAETDIDITNVMGELDNGLASAVSAISDGKITEEEFKKLPFRVQQSFVGWLSEQLSPEAVTPGTRH